MAEDRQNESIYDPKLSDMEVEAGYQRWLERMDDPQYKEEVVAEYRRRRKDDTRSDEEILAVYRRFSDPGPFIGERYDANGNLIVGKGYVAYTPEKRRVFQARAIATNHYFSVSGDDFSRDDRLLIAIGLSPEPEDESDEERATRLLETRMLAYALAGQGDFSVAITAGYLPKPRVEAQPRMVDEDGNLVQEAIAIEF